MNIQERRNSMFDVKLEQFLRDEVKGTVRKIVPELIEKVEKLERRVQRLNTKVKKLKKTGK